MDIPRRYDPKSQEGRIAHFWEEEGIYRFSRESARPIYSIDTPPPTVSGRLHLGHCYSYSQADFIARFMRMRGYNVYYPMGWDDNGLPTERLVETRLGVSPEEVGRENFVQAIVETTRELEEDYEKLWRRLGLSIDWRYTYSTISASARKVSQYSFIDLYEKGLAYRALSPAIWCPSCMTAIAQAEVNDLEREASIITIPFGLDSGGTFPVATTRPELLPACVAVFVHPDDARYRWMQGRMAETPIFRRRVPILADAKADPKKGTGIVMCCTFGDTTDVEWWRAHSLPLIPVIDRDGKLKGLAGAYAGLDVNSARERIIGDLSSEGLLLARERLQQTIRVHERCDTPVEYIEATQWFIRLLDSKERFLQAGRSISWYPSHMGDLYANWVQNLSWDWCISRQRRYGVPFPVWYCRQCRDVVLADPADLPVDPLARGPSRPCRCGGTEFEPEADVMDTWATSSVTPQIAGKWLEDKDLYGALFPFSLRPQAHDIIRTWAFYTIVKSLYHAQELPWRDIAISGHAVAAQGGKISKSRGGGPIDPIDVLDRFSADAVRYWAASTGLGRDTVISDEKISAGMKLATKLWNVAGFSARFLAGYRPSEHSPKLIPTDRWLLSRLQRVIQNVTRRFEGFEHAAALSELELLFWSTLADNYIEMVKGRLYQLPDGDPDKESARHTLYSVLLAVLKMLAPLMPYVTDNIFRLALSSDGTLSIHNSSWPQVAPELIDEPVEVVGSAIIGIATAVRRHKSAVKKRMGASLTRLRVATENPQLLGWLRACTRDIESVTRATIIDYSETPSAMATLIDGVDGLWLEIED